MTPSERARIRELAGKLTAELQETRALLELRTKEILCMARDNTPLLDAVREIIEGNTACDKWPCVDACYHPRYCQAIAKLRAAVPNLR
jgi:hypothetical protein